MQNTSAAAPAALICFLCANSFVYIYVTAILQQMSKRSPYCVVSKPKIEGSILYKYILRKKHASIYKGAHSSQQIIPRTL